MTDQMSIISLISPKAPKKILRKIDGVGRHLYMNLKVKRKPLTLL